MAAELEAGVGRVGVFCGGGAKYRFKAAQVGQGSAGVRVLGLSVSLSATSFPRLLA